jgi:hypothetical protein
MSRDAVRAKRYAPLERMRLRRSRSDQPDAIIIERIH